MKTSLLTCATLLAVLISSCKIHFTESTRVRIENSDNLAMEKVQFYNHEPIRLVYKSTSKQDQIKSGKVKFKNGFYHYQVDIPKHTKAVAKAINKNQLNIQFEDGENKTFVFKNNLNQNWELYQLDVKRTVDGEFVEYDGKEMQIIHGSNSLLKIKKSLKIANEKERRKVKGLSVR
ncbi:MAG: hypothetical protein ACPGRC_11330 [Salibacteraceae bacterium]